MDFTSFLFLFLFLPIAIISFLISKELVAPLVLLVFSFMFFFGGWQSSVEIIVGLVAVNFVFGQWIDFWRSTIKARVLLITGLVVNIGILVLYKSFTAYGSDAVVDFFRKMLPLFFENWLLSLVFPVGLSYIIFQVISYLVDVYKGTCASERNLFRFCLYIFFFPKILSGPIILYRSFTSQLSKFSINTDAAANGIRRFAIGLGKKALIANHLAKLVDAAFGLETPNFSPGIAWLALFAFALQVYFDFSGYIDMAIGLGEVFGFKLPENFNFPYTSRSIGEFWRRWHITLSAWFREYVFYPLERKRLPVFGQQANIIVVFLLTGLWHGLTLPYVFWGLIHGIAIALESTFFGRWLKGTWKPIQHGYTLSIVLFSWIFFRSNSLEFAWLFLKRMFGDLSGITILPFSATTPLPFIEPTFLLALVSGLILSLPVSSWLTDFRRNFVTRYPCYALPVQIVLDGCTLIMLWVSIASLAGGSFAPGIYDKF